VLGLCAQGLHIGDKHLRSRGQTLAIGGTGRRQFNSPFRYTDAFTNAETG
jgi:hypothetical protein